MITSVKVDKAAYFGKTNYNLAPLCLREKILPLVLIYNKQN